MTVLKPQDYSFQKGLIFLKWWVIYLVFLKFFVPYLRNLRFCRLWKYEKCHKGHKIFIFIVNARYPVALCVRCLSPNDDDANLSILEAPHWDIWDNFLKKWKSHYLFIKPKQDMVRFLPSRFPTLFDNFKSILPIQIQQLGQFQYHIWKKVCSYETLVSVSLKIYIFSRLIFLKIL